MKEDKLKREVNDKIVDIVGIVEEKNYCRYLSFERTKKYVRISKSDYNLE